MTTAQPDIAKLIDELTKATDELTKATELLRDARSRETSCINRANEAQKQLEAAVIDLKKKAPPGTDWRSEMDLSNRREC